ncbi:MAG: type IV secretion system DNA-binding domain-containing protein [Sandaracinobacter sp.]
MMNVGKRVVGSILLLTFCLGIASAMFPLVAIASRLWFSAELQTYVSGNGGPIAGYWAWWRPLDPRWGTLGWFQIFWVMVSHWLQGFDPNHALGYRLAASVGIGVVATAGTVIAATIASRPDAWTERTHVRGSKLIDRTATPHFVRNLVLREIEGRLGKVEALRAWFTLPRGASRRQTKAVWSDRRVQPREISIADAQSDASVMDIADVAAKAHGMVRMAGIPMPRSSETLHTLIAASPGTGKTVALRQLLTDLRRRGDRVICVDAGYDLSPNFREANDLILSPIDPESAGWALRNEVREATDWASLVQSVIPAPAGSAGVWRRKAQEFMTAICRAVGSEVDNRKLLEIATIWSTEQLLELLGDTPAAVALGEGGQEYLTSVRSNIAECLAGWQDGTLGDFSVRSYMNSPDEERWLWLPYADMQAGVVQPAIAAWIDIMINAATERRDAGGKPGGHRTWIIVDELNSMGLIPNLDKLGARLRKYDVCGVGIIQDDAQLKSTYGAYDAETIFSTFSNKVYFRCSSASLAKRISEDLGTTEYKETHFSTSRSTTDGKVTKSTSTSEQFVKRELLLPSEIQNLPTRCGVVKFAEVDAVLPAYLWVPPRPRK